MDSWSQREEKFKRKFAIGLEHIPELCAGISIPAHIKQIALFGQGAITNHLTVGGGLVNHVKDLLAEIADDLAAKPVARQAVSESFPILRSIQYMVDRGEGLGLIERKLALCSPNDLSQPQIDRCIDLVVTGAAVQRHYVEEHLPQVTAYSGDSECAVRSKSNVESG